MINNLEINGRKQTVEVEKDWNLLYIIREVLGLTGTKCGCSDGACGACVVIMNGEAVRSCRISAKKLAGAKITTIEGVADGERLHPIQQAFIDAGAVQCGLLYTWNDHAGQKHCWITFRIRRKRKSAKRCRIMSVDAVDIRKS